MMNDVHIYVSSIWHTKLSCPQKRHLWISVIFITLKCVYTIWPPRIFKTNFWFLCFWPHMSLTFSCEFNHQSQVDQEAGLFSNVEDLLKIFIHKKQRYLKRSVTFLMRCSQRKDHPAPSKALSGHLHLCQLGLYNLC